MLSRDRETITIAHNTIADIDAEDGIGLRDEEYLRLKVLSCMLPAI